MEKMIYTQLTILLENGIYEVHTGDVYTVYKKTDIDMGQYSQYNSVLNQKYNTDNIIFYFTISSCNWKKKLKKK